MKKLIVICLIALGLYLYCNEKSKISEKNILDEKYKSNAIGKNMQKTLMEYVDQNLGTGAIISIIDNGKIQVYAYGKKSENSDDLIDEETVFEIGSITKIFTTIALMEMVNQGKLRLDDPISKYLPDVKALQKDGKPITIWHLATHTSGLPRMPDNFNPKDPKNPYVDYTVEKLYEFLNGYKLTKDPGMEWEYSNLGMGILGHILSIIEHQSYDELIKKLICIPLGMKLTGQYITPEMKKHLTPGNPVSNWDLDVLVGAGGLRSNIKDMTIFLQANMGLINTPLYESMKAAQQEQCALSAKQCFGWIRLEKGDSSLIMHDGGTGGYASFLGFDSKHKKGVVILSNSNDGFPTNFGLHILDPQNYPLEKSVYNFDPAFSKPEYLNKFVGIYQIEPINHQGKDIPSQELHIIVTKNRLYLDGLQLLPAKENVFRLKNFPETYSIHFIVDKKNKIVCIEWIQPDGLFKAYPKASERTEN